MIETEKDEPDFKLFGKVFYHYLPSSESLLSIDLPGESENQKQFRNHHFKKDSNNEVEQHTFPRYRCK